MKTDLLLSAFENFRMAPTPIDEFEQTGKSVLASKMQHFIDQSQPIEFVMLGYPMKSTNNRDKVLGKVPDMAEEVSILNFRRFNTEFKKIYQPGVKVTIVSDGFVFNDLLGEPDNIVHEYKERVIDMAKNSPLEVLELKDFWKRSFTMTMARNSLMESFGIDESEMQRRILMDPDVNFLYRGMIKFMEEELAIKEFASGNQLHKAAKNLTRQMMLRNEAYSMLVKNEFPNSIRLSMHPSVNNGAKYSFQMIPSKKAWTSPWHSALLVTADGSYATVHRKDAIEAGYELCYKNGKPYNFIEA